MPDIKTIRVKGVGRVLVKPDYVVITMDLESKKMEYDEAMSEETDKIEALTEALVAIGFKKDDLKTKSFNVSTSERYENDSHGRSKRVFDGYVVSHSLKLSFDFKEDYLSKVLMALSICPADPSLGIKFTIKDIAAVNEEILRLAVENAKKKAKILCEASGVELGNLLDINYDWSEINIYSDTEYNNRYLADKSYKSAPGEIDFAPGDINASDTVTFLWEIH